MTERARPGPVVRRHTCWRAHRRRLLPTGRCKVRRALVRTCLGAAGALLVMSCTASERGRGADGTAVAPSSEPQIEAASDQPSALPAEGDESTPSVTTDVSENAAALEDGNGDETRDSAAGVPDGETAEIADAPAIAQDADAEPAESTAEPVIPDTLAPAWPFRGLVRVFSVDADDDGDGDLVVQYANSVDRSITEILIKNIAAGIQMCRGGIRYDSTGLHVGAGTDRVFIPWAGRAETNASVLVSPSDVVRYRTQPTTRSFQAGGTYFSVQDGKFFSELDQDGSVQDWDGDAVLVADGATSRLKVSDAVVGLRGTDGEFIAVTTLPSEPVQCEKQRTFVLSMRTGELVACGPHLGDIELISPRDEGLLVAHVRLPQMFDLTGQECGDGLAELPLDAQAQPGQSTGLMGHFAQLPAAPMPFAQRCTTGLGDVTLPDAGFTGIVRIFDTQDEICRDDASYRRVGVWLHDSRSRVTTRFTINGYRLPDCASEIRVTENGLEFAAAELRFAAPESSRGEFIGYRRVLLPWNSQPQAEPIPLHVVRSLRLDLRATPSWSDTLIAGTADIGVGMHTNGVRLSVGSLAAGYTLNSVGVAGLPPQSSLMGDYRVWGSSVMLDGTDGELVAFSVWRDSSPCSSRQTFVISLRDGEVTACGDIDNGDLLLLAPSQDNLAVGEARLAPSGWLDPASCPTALAEDFFEGIEQLPPRSPPSGIGTAQEPDLPEEMAPDLPFGGVIRSSLRYDPSRYSHDLVVEFFDPSSRSASEIVFTPEMFAGFEPGLSVVPDGLVVARRDGTGDRLVIPWGSAPEFVDVDEPDNGRWATEPPSLARHPTSLPLGSGTVRIAGYKPWPVGMLTLSHDDNTTTLVLSAPPEVVPESLDDVLGERSPSWTTSLRGTDGNALAFTYLHSYFDDCLSLCGLELTYLVSLLTGEVLTCGVEPRYSEFAFIAAPDAASPSAPLKLPPTGWLKPEPCLAGILANGLGCSILVHESEPETRCIREFSLASAASGIAGAEITPVEQISD